MRSQLMAFEPNPYKRVAMLEVTRDIDFHYSKNYDAGRIAWLVLGKFTIDDVTWVAAELVDDECLADKEETEELYRTLDRASVSRLFALNRIQRKLTEVRNGCKN